MSRQKVEDRRQNAVTDQSVSSAHASDWNSLWVVIFFASAPLGVFEFVLPLYGVALGADAASIGWLFSVFSITALVLRPLVGYLLDQPTTTPTQGNAAFCLLPSAFCLLMIGLITYAIALSMFAVAETTAMLVAARLVQGVASTTTWLTITVLLAEESDSERRGAAFGRLNSLSVWGSGLGATWTVLVVGLFDGQTRTQIQTLLPELAQITRLPLDAIRWPTPILSSITTLHIVFWGYVGFVVLGLIVLATGRRTKDEGRRTKDEENNLIVKRLDEGRKIENKGHEQDSEGSFVFRLSSFVPNTWHLLLASFLRSGGYALTLPVLTVYLDQRFGAGLVGVGLAYALPGVVYALAPSPLGRLADRVGHGRAAVVGLFASVAVYLALPLLPSIWLLVPLWTFEALCFSLAGPALSALLTDCSPPGGRGSAFALYTLVGGIGAAFTPALGGWLYDHFGAALPFWGNGLLVGAAAVSVAFGMRLGMQAHRAEI